jgi:glycosyltransferase involved in cell wall biosynthesis
MKVGLVTDKFQGTGKKWGFGGTIYISQLSRRLKERGIDVTVFSYAPFHSSFDASKVKLVEIGLRHPQNSALKLMVTTFHILKMANQMHKMDLLHSISGSSVLALSLMKNSNTKFIFDFRVPFSNVNRLYNWYKHILFSLCNPDYVIFIDQVSLQHYREVFGRANCGHLPIATDFADFIRRENSRHEQDGLKILFAGVLRESKGLLDLLEAMEEVWKRHPEVELQIAGYGPLQDRVEGASRGNNKIKYLGFVPHRQMPEVLSNVDMLVLPSYREGFSRTVLEGIACGLPVITTAVGELSRLETQGVAKVIKPGDPKVLVEAIEELIEDKKLRDSYGDNARKYVKDNHTWDKLVEELLALYTHLTGLPQ